MLVSRVEHHRNNFHHMKVHCVLYRTCVGPLLQNFGAGYAGTPRQAAEMLLAEFWVRVLGVKAMQRNIGRRIKVELLLKLAVVEWLQVMLAFFVLTVFVSLK